MWVVRLVGVGIMCLLDAVDSSGALGCTMHIWCWNEPGRMAGLTQTDRVEVQQLSAM